MSKDEMRIVSKKKAANVTFSCFVLPLRANFVSLTSGALASGNSASYLTLVGWQA